MPVPWEAIIKSAWLLNCSHSVKFNTQSSASIHVHRYTPKYMPHLVEEEVELDNPRKVALQGIHRCHLSPDTKMSFQRGHWLYDEPRVYYQYRMFLHHNHPLVTFSHTPLSLSLALHPYPIVKQYVGSPVYVKFSQLEIILPRCSLAPCSRSSCRLPGIGHLLSLLSHTLCLLSGERHCQ